MKISRLLPLIGIAIFFFLLLNIDLPKIATIILRINLLLFGAAILVNIGVVILKAFKWKLIFSSYRIPVPYSRFLKSWLVGLSLSFITPGKFGDFAKAYYLKDKATLGKGLTTVFVERIIDILTLFILAIIGLSLFAIYYSPNLILLITTYILFAAFMIAIFLLSKKRVAAVILRPFYSRLAPEKYKESIKSIYSDLYEGVDLILKSKKSIVLVTVLTFFVWLCSTYVIYLISLSLGFEIPYSFLIIVFPIISLLKALPISFSGLGTRDATLVFFFSFLALAPEASISISLVYLLNAYILAFVGFALWFRNPIKIRK